MCVFILNILADSGELYRKKTIVRIRVGHEHPLGRWQNEPTEGYTGMWIRQFSLQK